MRAYDVIIVGAGPAGIISALELSRASNLSILVLEKGHDIDRRVCPSSRGSACRKCYPCSVVCGWGGAGAYSDGKLTLSTEIGGALGDLIPHEVFAQLVEYVDQIYCEFGAPEKVYGATDELITVLTKKATLADLRFIPSRIRHLGTGHSKQVLKAMFVTLKNRIDFLPKVRVERILTDNHVVTGVVTSDGHTYRGRYVIVAPGREGSTWLVSEANRLGLSLSVNPVDIGVRVEVPLVVLEPLTSVLYESKLVYYSKSFDDRVRTFCMCPGGEVVVEHNNGYVTVNGHTHADTKTDNTNFALLVSKAFTEPFKDPIGYGKYIAGLANLLGRGVIVQRLGDLLVGRRSTPDRIRKGLVVPTLEQATPGDLSLVFPYRHLISILEMLEALDALSPGVYSRNTLLYGVEAKFYSSRIRVSSSLESEVGNLFCIGDGAGLTRGLMQASISGVVAAREIIKR
jgi:uncharacterized FAD-dependent dehydrogenase